MSNASNQAKKLIVYGVSTLDGTLIPFDAYLRETLSSILSPKNAARNASRNNNNVYEIATGYRNKVKELMKEIEPKRQRPPPRTTLEDVLGKEGIFKRYKDIFGTVSLVGENGTINNVKVLAFERGIIDAKIQFKNGEKGEDGYYIIKLYLRSRFEMKQNGFVRKPIKPVRKPRTVPVQGGTTQSGVFQSGTTQSGTTQSGGSFLDDVTTSDMMLMGATGGIFSLVLSIMYQYR